MTPRGTLGLFCVHIAQLMTHQGIYTLPFTLQLCYKPLSILQRVTKSQKFHISNHDGLKKLCNINFKFSENNRFIALQACLQVYYSLTIRETRFPMIKVMEEVNQPQNWLRNIVSSFTNG